jgi:hypothetical protein
MIKSPEYGNISLDTILNEVMQLSYSVGECKSSIDHIEDTVIRSHRDLRETLNDINKRLYNFEGREQLKEKRSNLITNFFQLTFTNVLKWASCLMFIGIILGSNVKVDASKILYRVEKYIAQQ